MLSWSTVALQLTNGQYTVDTMLYSNTMCINMLRIPNAAHHLFMTDNVRLWVSTVLLIQTHIHVRTHTCTTQWWFWPGVQYYTILPIAVDACNHRFQLLKSLNRHHVARHLDLGRVWFPLVNCIVYYLNSITYTVIVWIQPALHTWCKHQMTTVYIHTCLPLYSSPLH